MTDDQNNSATDVTEEDKRLGALYRNWQAEKLLEEQGFVPVIEPDGQRVYFEKAKVPPGSKLGKMGRTLQEASEDNELN